MNDIASVLETINEIPDVQGSEDTRKIAIDRVGIKDIRHPVVVSDRAGREQHTNSHDYEISVPGFRGMVAEMVQLLDAQTGRIEMTFPYFVLKAAPVSGVKSLLDYTVTFIGESNNGTETMSVKVVVPCTTLCPCSKKISAYGAHNQRSHVTVEAKVSGFIWIEEFIDMVESVASCELYGLLKRPDEKYVTERAYDNPRFVEDMVRETALKLNADDRILSYTVESENFESIHNHSAYALVHKDKTLAAN